MIGFEIHKEDVNITENENIRITFFSLLSLDFMV